MTRNWNKYPESTPPENMIVWTYNSDGELRLCRYKKTTIGWKWKKEFAFCNILSKFGIPDLKVTHWMEALPELPK